MENALLRDMVASDPRLRKQLQKMFPSVAPPPAPLRPAGPSQAELERRRPPIENHPQRARLRAQGYTDEGLDELERFMGEHGIADYEAAAARYERMHPPPEPLVSGGGRPVWGTPQPMPQGPDLTKLLQGDDEGFLGPAVANALKEVRGY